MSAVNAPFDLGTSPTTNQIILHCEAKVIVAVFIVNEVCSLLDQSSSVIHCVQKRHLDFYDITCPCSQGI
jgi:hypothetical protein